MPPLVLSQPDLAAYGAQWTANGGALSRSAPYSSMQLGNLVDETVAEALAAMLGGVPVRTVSARGAAPLYPPEPDCVERGEVAIVGGIRKQQFDVAYRPDGVRFAFDSKTLNDAESVGKIGRTWSTTLPPRRPPSTLAFLWRSLASSC